MKRIKKFYREHRVFTILLAIIIVCLGIITTVLFQCFYVGNADKYGDRLEGIENHKISESKISDYEVNVTNDEKVKSTKVDIVGKIIYIKIVYNPGCSLEEAESIAAQSLEKFSDDEKSFYFFNFTLKQSKSESSDGFLISGAKHQNNATISWNNNNEVNSDETEE